MRVNHLVASYQVFTKFCIHKMYPPLKIKVYLHLPAQDMGRKVQSKISKARPCPSLNGLVGQLSRLLLLRGIHKGINHASQCKSRNHIRHGVLLQEHGR